jgi:hypothetical protein
MSAFYPVGEAGAIPRTPSETRLVNPLALNTLTKSTSLAIY